MNIQANKTVKELAQKLYIIYGTERISWSELYISAIGKHYHSLATDMIDSGYVSREGNMYYFTEKCME